MHIVITLQSAVSIALAFVCIALAATLVYVLKRTETRAFRDTEVRK
jgi:hypothetical protein